MRKIDSSLVHKYQQNTLNKAVPLRDVANIEVSRNGYNILRGIKTKFIKSNNIVDIVFKLGCKEITLPEDCSRLFKGISTLQVIDISNTNTDNVNNIQEMFSGCSKLKIIIWNEFKNIDTLKTDDVFQGCTELKYIITKESDGTYTLVERCNSFEEYIKQYTIIDYLGDDALGGFQDDIDDILKQLEGL